MMYKRLFQFINATSTINQLTVMCTTRGERSGDFCLLTRISSKTNKNAQRQPTIYVVELNNNNEKKKHLKFAII